MASETTDAFTTAVHSMHSVGEWLVTEVDPRIYAITHSILVAYKMRQSEIEGRLFAIRYPIASCATHFIVSQFGTILSNILLGLSPLHVCTNPQDLFISFLVWYLVFFSPWDFAFSLLSLLPLRIVLEVIHEVKRAINVNLGVLQASKVYPEAWTVMAIIGTIRGSGTNWGITFSRLITNSPLASEHELIKFVGATRLSLVVGILLGLSQVGKLDLDPLALLSAVATVMIAVRLGSLVHYWGDPFSSLQGFLWKPFVLTVREEDEVQNADNQSEVSLLH